MRSTWSGIGVSLVVGTLVAAGCSSSSDAGSGGGPTSDAGHDAPPPPHPGGDPPPGGGGGNDASIADAGDDGAIFAPEVDVTFGTCPAFDACGGDEKATWTVSGGCLSDRVLDQAKANCAALTTSNVVIKAKGIVMADGTHLSRRTQVKLSATAHLPAECTNSQDCALVAAFVKGQTGFDSVTCVAGGDAGSCDCDVANTFTQITSDTYTKNGNTITTGGGEEYVFCVTGNQLQYAQTKPADAYPVTFQLTK